VGVAVALGGGTVSLAAATFTAGEGDGATGGFGLGSVEREATELDCDAAVDAVVTSIGGSVDAAGRGGAGLALGGRADGPTELDAERTADDEGAEATTGVGREAAVDACSDDGSGGRTNAPSARVAPIEGGASEAGFGAGFVSAARPASVTVAEGDRTDWVCGAGAIETVADVSGAPVSCGSL
jgi:hypothetical protein